MKKLKIISIILSLILICLVFTACPSNKKDIVDHTLSLSEKTFNNVNKEIDISTDDYTLKCSRDEYEVRVVYSTQNTLYVNFEKQMKDCFEIKLNAFLAQGTLRLEEVNYLKENCKLKYVFNFYIFLGDTDYVIGDFASYELLVFENDDSAAIYFDFMFPSRLNGGELNGNRVFYPNREGCDYMGEITPRKINEIFNEINTLIENS